MDLVSVCYVIPEKVLFWFPSLGDSETLGEIALTVLLVKHS